jgi:hypothetical protein
MFEELSLPILHYEIPWPTEANKLWHYSGNHALEANQQNPVHTEPSSGCMKGING